MKLAYFQMLEVYLTRKLGKQHFVSPDKRPVWTEEEYMRKMYGLRELRLCGSLFWGYLGFSPEDCDAFSNIYYGRKKRKRGTRHLATYMHRTMK